MHIRERFSRLFRPEKASQSDTETLREMRAWRSQLVQGLLRIVAIVGPLAVGFSSYGAYSRGYLELIPVYLFPYLVVLGMALWPKAPYGLRAGAVLILLYGLGLSDFFKFGWREDVRIFFLTFAVLTAMFFGVREGVVALTLAVATLLGVGFASLYGLVTLPRVAEPLIAGLVPVSLISDTAVVVLMGALLIVIQNYLVPRFMEALAQSHALARQLSVQQSELETRTASIQAANYALQRRAMQLEAGSAVGQAIASIFDVDQLLDRTAQLISEGFGFYHTGVFLLDESGEQAVLQAASSEGGRRMLARGHHLARGEGMVGWVVEHRRPRIALDVGEDATHFVNPDLPATRSEMALPIMAGGHLLGILDVQSTEEAAFDEDDVRSLESLTGQLAVAIENARRVTEEAALLEATSPFYRLSRRFATARTVHEVYTAILDTVREYLPRRVLIVMPAAETRAYLVAELRGNDSIFPKSEQEFPEITEDPALFTYLTTLNQPTLVEDFSDLPQEIPPEYAHAFGRLAQRFQVRSLAVVPIPSAGDLPVLLLVAFQDQHAFGAAEEQLYRTLADIAAVTLQRLQLLEASQRRVERELRLREFSDQVLGIFDLQVMVAQAARSLQALADADGVVVALERPEALTEGAGNDGKS